MNLIQVYLITSNNSSFKVLTAMKVKMVFEDVTINTCRQLDRYQHSEGIYCPTLKIKQSAFQNIGMHLLDPTLLHPKTL